MKIGLVSVNYGETPSSLFMYMAIFQRVDVLHAASRRKQLVALYNEMISWKYF